MNRNIFTALLICTAFLTRLAVVNFFGTSAPASSQSIYHFAKGNSSTLCKRRTFDTIGQSYGAPLVLISETAEEKRHEDSPRRATIVERIQNHYSSIVKSLRLKPQELVPFANYITHTSSYRYLVLQVLRT
jgi:hypothetical protein